MEGTASKQHGNGNSLGSPCIQAEFWGDLAALVVGFSIFSFVYWRDLEGICLHFGDLCVYA